MKAENYLRRETLGFRERWATGEFREGGVADVLEVGDADFAGIEGVASEAADKGEEGYALVKGGIGFGVFAEGDEIEDGLSLLGRAGEIGAGEAVGAKTVEPEESASEFELVGFVFAGEEINEFGRAGFDGTAGFFVFGDDGIAK